MKLPKAITQLVKWTDKESSRYALSGVRIGRQSGQCFAEATDGRRLALLEWKEKGGEFDAILSGKEFTKAAKASKTSQASLAESIVRPNVVINPSTVVSDLPPLTVEVNKIPVPLVDGRWPKSEDLFDESRRGQHTQNFTSAGLRELARRTEVKVGEASVLLDVTFLSDQIGRAHV